MVCSAWSAAYVKPFYVWHIVGLTSCQWWDSVGVVRTYVKFEDLLVTTYFYRVCHFSFCHFQTTIFLNSFVCLVCLFFRSFIFSSPHSPLICLVTSCLYDEITVWQLISWLVAKTIILISIFLMKMKKCHLFDTCIFNPIFSHNDGKQSLHIIPLQTWCQSLLSRASLYVLICYYIELRQY